MNLISSYKVKILYYHHILDETVSAYQKAVAFFLHVCDREWTDIEPLKLKERNNYMERLTISHSGSIGRLQLLCIQSRKLGEKQTKRQRTEADLCPKYHAGVI